jgi:hypothetical protein
MLKQTRKSSNGNQAVYSTLPTPLLFYHELWPFAYKYFVQAGCQVISETQWCRWSQFMKHSLMLITWRCWILKTLLKGWESVTKHRAPNKTDLHPLQHIPSCSLSSSLHPEDGGSRFPQLWCPSTKLHVSPEDCILALILPRSILKL